MKITAHTLVKNEQRYLWYAVTSVIDYMDQVLLWDTDSTDKTMDIIKALRKKYGKKISFRQIGKVDVDGFTKVRQQMIEETKGDWVFILDGDEVWWEDGIKKLVTTIQKNKNKLDSVVTRYKNVVGDIYHFQEEKAGLYQIDEHKGHLTIRAMNMSIPGLSVQKPHGQQGFYDKDGILVQKRAAKRRHFIEKVAYLHFTNMIRSKDAKKDSQVIKRSQKLKYEIGHDFPLDFYYPEAFFRERPKFVPNVWQRMSPSFFAKSYLMTVPRKIKRRLFKSKTGY